tara:strand:- start:452 stop:814 length:363 start_codon:yes stop_codon:yes gene_type:complete
MKIKTNRSRHALREGILFTADGVEGALYPKWLHVLEGVVLIDDYGADPMILGMFDAFQDGGLWYSRDPRLVLQSLRWLLKTVDIRTVKNLRLFEQDIESAQAQFDTLSDDYGHIIIDYIP